MIVTLLTDFGTRDYFVGAMKAAILSRDARIRIVDLTHEVPRHDVEHAAFLLAAVAGDFPAGTVHVVVVDPGVGSERRAIAVRAGPLHFVAPDNGVLTLATAGAPDLEVREITHPDLRSARMGNTFHGRDLFAPAGAALALGHPFDQVGPRVTDAVTLGGGVNRREAGETVGQILHVDHFGNCVTSIRTDALEGGASAYRFRVGEVEIEEVRSCYAGGAGAFVIAGSAGYLEIAVDRGSAAETLGVSRGDEVRVRPR